MGPLAGREFSGLKWTQSSAANGIEPDRCSRYDEPRLEDMLVDSIVKAVMEADGVDPCKLEAELKQTAARLHAIRAHAEIAAAVEHADRTNTDGPP
jgi:hypothetical protein